MALAAVSCTAVTTTEASFSSVLIGSSSGVCNTGYSGTIAATCVLNATDTTKAYFGTTIGSCTRTSHTKS